VAVGASVAKAGIMYTAKTAMTSKAETPIPNFATPANPLLFMFYDIILH
jgi:hypothetical protein